jgi:hypothetical protein
MRKSRWATSIVLALLLPLFLAVLTANAGPSGTPELPLDAESSGAPLGDIFQISFTTMRSWIPAVAYHAQRQEYLVVWENDRPNNGEIQAQRLSASGDLIGNPFFVSAGPGSDRSEPDVVHNSQRQEYLVVWLQEPTGPRELHARAVSAQGGVIGSDVTVATEVPGGPSGGPKVAYSPVSDKYLVVWVGGSPEKILGQVLNSDGSTSGTNFAIAEPHAYVESAHVAFNRSRNEYLAVWAQMPRVGNDWDVHARRLQGNGTPMFPENLALKALPYNQRPVAVAAMPTEPAQGQYLVGILDSWTTFEPNLWAQRVAGEGQVLGDRLPSFVSADRDHPLAIAADEHTRHYLLVGGRILPGISGQPSIVLGREMSLDGQFLGEGVPIGGGECQVTGRRCRATWRVPGRLGRQARYALY